MPYFLKIDESFSEVIACFLNNLVTFLSVCSAQETLAESHAPEVIVSVEIDQRRFKLLNTVLVLFFVKCKTWATGRL